MKKKAYYTIGTISKMYNIHPQTLRLYEKEGLLTPSRTEGNTRVYTDEDVEKLEFILTLTRDMGVNLAGIEIILRLKSQIDELQKNIELLVQLVSSKLNQEEEREQTSAIIQASEAALLRAKELIKKK